jgi:hypothetical protein
VAPAPRPIEAAASLHDRRGRPGPGRRTGRTVRTRHSPRENDPAVQAHPCARADQVFHPCELAFQIGQPQLHDRDRGHRLGRLLAGRLGDLTSGGVFVGPDRVRSSCFDAPGGRSL